MTLEELIKLHTYDGELDRLALLKYIRSHASLSTAANYIILDSLIYIMEQISSDGK